MVMRLHSFALALFALSVLLWLLSVPRAAVMLNLLAFCMEVIALQRDRRQTACCD